MDNSADDVQIIESDSDESYDEPGNGHNSSSSIIEISDTSSDVSNNEDDSYKSSDSETEAENENWDDDCIVLPIQQRETAIRGFHVLSDPSCSSELEGPPMKKCKLTQKILMNNHLVQEEFFDKLKSNWQSNENFSDKFLEIITNPFKLCIVDQFIHDRKILDEVRKEIYDINWNRRKMDLYEFFQSNDLKDTEHDYLKNLYEFLQTDVMSWVQNLTGIELNKISATCSVYTDTDYLLVHDDLQDDRAVAFILYLTDPPLSLSSEELWTPEMGGALELFSKDKNGHPLVSVKQIYPKHNRFVFFNVTNDSYHQVGEILNMDHCRMSINGWFHTAKPKSYELPTLEIPIKGLFSNERISPLESNIAIADWVSEKYLRREVKKQIQKDIESQSEISLSNFLKPEKFNELSELLAKDDVKWELIGPPNRKKYEVLSNENIPNAIGNILELFKSKNMFCLLSELTELDLNPDIKEDAKPTVRLELQRWSPGCYSIFTEYDWDAESELDLIMYFADSPSIAIVGGEIMYVSGEENVEDALITVQPNLNTLNIIYRDSARIVKYVSNRSYTKYFYTLMCSYKE